MKSENKRKTLTPWFCCSLRGSNSPTEVKHAKSVSEVWGAAVRTGRPNRLRWRRGHRSDTAACALPCSTAVRCA